MVVACPLCGLPVERPEDPHPCYIPSSFDRLFRWAWWDERWRALKPTLSPQAVQTAYAEFAQARAQGPEAVRRYALDVYRAMELGGQIRERMQQEGRDPREFLAMTVQRIEEKAHEGAGS
jgi:hypothetical protein